MVTTFKFSPNSRFLVTHSFRKALVLNVDKKTSYIARYLNMQVNGAVFTPDSKSLIISYFNSFSLLPNLPYSVAAVLNLERGIYTAEAKSDSNLDKIAVSPNGKFLFAACQASGKSSVWDLESAGRQMVRGWFRPPALKTVSKSYFEGVEEFHLNPNGRFMITKVNGSFYSVDLEAEKVIAQLTFDVETKNLNVIFAPTGSLMVTRGYYDSPRLMSVGGSVAQNFKMSSGYGYMQFSANGQYLLLGTSESAGINPQIKIWTRADAD